MSGVHASQSLSVLELGQGLVDTVQALTNVEETQFFRTVPLPHDEVERLQSALEITSTRLRYIDNASRPINRLPTSTLTRIFHVLKDLAPKPADHPFPLASLHWVAVTHVCIHWRDVALATPSLWTHILLHAKGGASLINAFLTRSENLPLTLTLGRNPWNNQSIARIQNYRRGLRHVIDIAADRVERVIVEPGFPIDDVLRADLLGQKLSRELSFALPGFGRSSLNFGSGDGDSLSVLFSSAISRVQHLELYSSVIPHFLRRPEPFQQLSILQLFHTKDTPPLSQGPEKDIFKLSKIMQTLSASSSTLRQLALVGTPFWDDRDSATNGVPLVALQSLESIEIGDWPSASSMSTFLLQLRVPPTALRCIWGTGLRDPESSTGVYPFLAPVLPDPEVSTDKSPIPVIRVVLSSVVGGDMISSHKGTLYINGAIPFDIYTSLLLEPSRLALETVEELVLTPLLEPLNVEQWRSLFKLLPNVERIKVLDTEASTLIRALHRTKDDDLPLPELTSMTIRYSAGSSLSDPLDIEYTTHPYTMAVALTFLARERSHANHPLSRVHLRLDSRVLLAQDRADLDMARRDLKEWVPEVTWVNTEQQWYELAAKAKEERTKEKKDPWRMVMHEFGGIWPTKAVYFTQSLGGKDAVVE